MTDRNEHPPRAAQHVLGASVDRIICDATVDNFAPSDNLDAAAAMWR